MAETTTTTLVVDKKLKEDANEVFKLNGLSFVAAVEAFLKATVREQKVPFDLE